MAKFRCPRAGCNFKTKDSLFGGVKGVICPNCRDRNAMKYGRDNKDFICLNCNTFWHGICCPECGTMITRPLLFGIL